MQLYAKLARLTLLNQLMDQHAALQPAAQMVKYLMELPVFALWVHLNLLVLV